MDIKDCLDIISECVGDGLKTKFDHLTSGEKNQVQSTCDEMLYAIERAFELAERTERGFY